MSTILLALQKFASFDDKSRRHKRSGDLYLSLYRKIRLLEAEFNADIKNLLGLNQSLNLLVDQYDQTTSVSPVIQEKDYECAQRQQTEGNMAYTKQELKN